MDATALRSRYPLYGPGVFDRQLPEPGHARVQFDIDDGERRRLLVAGFGRRDGWRVQAAGVGEVRLIRQASSGHASVFRLRFVHAPRPSTALLISSTLSRKS